MLDIGVIHNEEGSVIDLLAKSCKEYLPNVNLQLMDDK